MTRKHFKAIAEALNRRLKYAETEEERNVVLATAREIAGEMRQFNYAFDRERFMAAVTK